MGFFTNYNRRRLELTGGESAATLQHMQEYFSDGENWTRGAYENATGSRCLVGAANHVRVSSIDDAKHWLRLAIAEVEPGMAHIEDFNDTRHTFAEVAAVIERARQLAAESAARALPPPSPVVEVLPPSDAVPVVFHPRRRESVRRRSLTNWVMD
jgi:hypothetical protein